ncbi:MAG: hypothetical protein QOE31_231 [Solirubrobacteraceae bacterium]|jgi:hypothetical protein|nr:hypothetical protein [Solirubrobacteraceae bacterium]
MDAKSHDARAPTHDEQHEPDRGRDDTRDGAGADADRSDDRARGSRVGAAQIAAPSTRRWRRPGRFARAR